MRLLTLYFECGRARNGSSWVGSSNRVKASIFSSDVANFQRTQAVILLQQPTVKKTTQNTFFSIPVYHIANFLSAATMQTCVAVFFLNSGPCLTSTGQPLIRQRPQSW